MAAQKGVEIQLRAMHVAPRETPLRILDQIAVVQVMIGNGATPEQYDSRQAQQQ